MRLLKYGVVLGTILALGTTIGMAERFRVVRSVPRGATTTVAVIAVETRQRVLLRMAGNDLLAATIINPLASDYLQRIGAQGVRVDHAAAPWTTEISGRMLDGERVVILVRSSTTGDGIQELIHGEVDIAMAGRQTTPEELRSMPTPSEDLESSQQAVAVARSAIVMTVHPGNPVDTITLDQLRAVYAGELTNWAQLGGHDSPIHVFARERASAARQLFDSVVMGATPSAQSVEESLSFDAMPAMVRNDPNAIGYMAIPDGLKVLRIEIPGHVMASPPDSYHLTTGDYPLTQVLRLYRNPRDGNPDVSHFLRNAAAVQSKVIVLLLGFAELGPQLLVPAIEPQAPPGYSDLTRNALRVSTTIRFTDGSEQIDPGVQNDLDVLAHYLRVLQVRGDKLLHIAFSEDTGDCAKNRAISERLGAIVTTELERRNATAGNVVPFGARMPVASNLTSVGRGLNRRVETWIIP
jgi:phosphate transport system substrate-binding protein